MMPVYLVLQMLGVVLVLFLVVLYFFGTLFLPGFFKVIISHAMKLDFSFDFQS